MFVIKLHRAGEGLEGMMRVTQARDAVAVLAKIIVIALLALPASSTDRVQADVAIDAGVDGLYQFH